MKKALTFLLLAFYFTTTTGFSLSMHYCMDRLESSQIGTSTDDICHKCGMHKDGHCCRDEVKVIRMQTVHILSQPLNVDFSLHENNNTQTIFLSLPLANVSDRAVIPDHGPPLSDRDVCIRNCVFRI